MKKGKRNMGKIAQMTIAFVCVFIFGFVLSSPKIASNDHNEVYAMMESNANLESKMVYLEKRVNSEIATLNMLIGYSDLCSNRYLNELASLSLSMQFTIDGYDMVKDEVSSSDKIVAKYDDYAVLIKSYDNMVENIQKEKYDEALDDLKDINEIKDNEYIGIENEIARLGE